MTTAPHPGLPRALAPGLPRPLWILQAGLAANAFGNGLVLPFLVVYLHNVRGLPLAASGLALGAYGTAGLVASSVAGAAADRLGARRVLLAAIALSAVGFGLFPAVRSVPGAFAVAILAGLGNGAFWPCQSSVLVALTPEDRRHAAMALNRWSLNLGLGLGGLVGGLVASEAHPASYTVLFLADAGSFAVFAAALLLVPAPPRLARPARGGGYRAVLRDRPFVAFLVLNALFVAGGFAQLEATLPAFARNEAGLDERAIGFLFALNVAVILVAQMPVARVLAGRRRMASLALMTVAFGAAWLLVLMSGLSAGGAAPLLVGAVLVFSLGECLHAPNQGGLVADLARPELRGRYFALSTNSYAAGFAVGPAVGGLLLAGAPLALWPIAAGACLAGGALALALERRLPLAVRRTPA